MAEQNTQLLVLDPKDFGLEKNEAQKISEVFTPMMKTMEKLEKEYNEVIKMPVNAETAEVARDLRLRYVKTRTGTAEIHKTAKAYHLSAGRFCDGWRNVQLFAAEGKEDMLEKIEKHVEIAREKELDKLEAKRKEELGKYDGEYEFVDLRGMPEENYQTFFENAKKSHKLRKEKEEAEEKERLKKEKEEAEERERVQKENDQLKKEAEEKEKKAEAERKKTEESSKKAEAEQKKKLKAEREKREKIEAELQAKNEEEARIKKAEEDRIKKEQEEKETKDKEARLAPDKVKLQKLAVHVTELEMPEVKSKEAKEIVKVCVELLNKTSNYIKEKTLNL